MKKFFSSRTLIRSAGKVYGKEARTNAVHARIGPHLGEPPQALGVTESTAVASEAQEVIMTSAGTRYRIPLHWPLTGLDHDPGPLLANSAFLRNYSLQ